VFVGSGSYHDPDISPLKLAFSVLPPQLAQVEGRSVARLVHVRMRLIPHPRLKERAFVLVPLAEISPHLVHPQSGERVIDLLKKVSQEGVRLWSR